MNRFTTLLGFFGNFILSTIFGWDILDYYCLNGINIISNDVNRVFIMWIGFSVALYSAMWFMNQYLNIKYNNSSK